MDTCQFENSIDAYFDGEMTAEKRSAFERHLAGCAPCQSELQQTRQLAAFIAAAPKAHLSDRARRDLYALAPAVGEGVYMRIAEWTTALAASVIIAASAWMYYARPATQTVAEQANLSLSPVMLNPPRAHDVSEMPDDPQLVDWVTANVAAGQNQ